MKHIQGSVGKKPKEGDHTESLETDCRKILIKLDIKEIGLKDVNWIHLV
jgi:hypothetical protein